MKHLKDIKLLLEDLNRIPGVSGKGVESWVNVKIDKDLPLRISRYATALDKYLSDANDLEGKLDFLSNPVVAGKPIGPQCKLSIMMLLQYLKEIRSNFDASSSGHLFEDYIAGLLHGRKLGGYGHADYEDSKGNTCQIKFYQFKAGKIDLNPKPCKYYIIGLKKADEVYIWIIDSKPGSKFHVDDLVVDVIDSAGRPKKQIDMKILKDEMIHGTEMPYVLSFTNINSIIKSIGEVLEDYIAKLYGEISELHYNIETIITGIDKNQKFIGSNIDKHYDKATKNIAKIQSNLTDVQKNLKPKLRKGI